MRMFFGPCIGPLRRSEEAGRFTKPLPDSVLALVGISMPLLWVGPLTKLLPGLQVGALPNGGYVALRQPVAVVLPPDHALDGALAAVHRGLLAHTALDVLDTINEDYVRTARAKGLTEARCCSGTCCATR